MTSAPYNLIVLDDGSDKDDVGLEWLIEQHEAEKLTLVRSKDRKWLSANFNAGIKNIKGDFVKLDSDVVIYSRDWLEKMVGFMAEHPKCAELSAAMVTSAEPGAFIRHGPKNILQLEDTVVVEKVYDWVGAKGLEPVTVDIVPGPCTYFRREAFDEVGGFDEAFTCDFTDANLCMTLRKAGWENWYHPQIRMSHEGHSANRGLPGFKAATDRDRELFKQKWGVNW